MKIGIFGMGAVGQALLRELNEYDSLYILADDLRLEKYKQNGFKINDNLYFPKLSSNEKVDLLIVCVKNYHLEKSLKDIKPFVDKNTIILPLLNGIMAHDILKDYFKDNNVLYGVINVEANRSNNEVRTSKIINLQFGEEYNTPIKDYLLDIKKIFDKYDLTNNIYPDMKKRVWNKWMLNMGINQISALCNATYKDMSHPLIRELFNEIFLEVYKVALAYNINLTEDDIRLANERCNNFNSDRVTSLTIDFLYNDQNELDSFSKTLIDLADAKGIDVNVNKVLYKLLKSLDDNKKRKALA